MLFLHATNALFSLNYVLNPKIHRSLTLSQKTIEFFNFFETQNSRSFKNPFQIWFIWARSWDISNFFSDIATDFPTKHNTPFLAIFHMKEDVSFGCHFLLVRARKACLVANERKFDVDYETFRCFWNRLVFKVDRPYFLRR